MRNIFRKKAEASEAEQALKKWGVRFEKLEDGTLLVRGDLHIAKKGLTALPDVSNVLVQGNFNCSGNKLTSLKGAPRHVEGNFDCSHNWFDSLEGGSEFVGHGFFCSGNPLRSLDHKPKKFQVLLSDLGNQLGYEKAEGPSPEALATVLQAPMKLSRPITFRPAAPR